MITLDTLTRVCRAAPLATLEKYADRLNNACAEFQISTPKRQAAFLAQIAHESGEFRWVKEIWGPTKQQKKYEPPSELATKLGNTEKGDGKRYCGRGLIQITGRHNYGKCSQALFPEAPHLLLERPELLEQPTQACRSAAWYWNWKALNYWADRGAFQTITKLINGGLNGYESRVKYWKRAIGALTPPDYVMEPDD